MWRKPHESKTDDYLSDILTVLESIEKILTEIRDDPR